MHLTSKKFDTFCSKKTAVKAVIRNSERMNTEKVKSQTVI